MSNNKSESCQVVGGQPQSAITKAKKILTTQTQNIQPPQNRREKNTQNKNGKTQRSKINQTYQQTSSIKIGKKIGQGLTSRVYIGVHTQYGTVCAKIINLEYEKNKLGVQLLNNEIEILTVLQPHPNVLRLYQVVRRQQKKVIVTELCQGTIRSLPKNKINEAMKGVFQGYRHLVAHHVIHRDLKPENIFIRKLPQSISRNGGASSVSKAAPKGCSKQSYNLNQLQQKQQLQAVIADYGFACYETTQKYSNVGSPLYMAPEVLQYQKYSQKSDIFSLGVIWYQLLTGSMPWKASSEAELLNKIKSHLPTAHTIQNTVIKKLILGCLSVEPSNRPDVHNICSIFQQIGNGSIQTGANGKVLQSKKSLQKDLKSDKTKINSSIKLIQSIADQRLRCHQNRSRSITFQNQPNCNFKKSQKENKKTQMVGLKDNGKALKQIKSKQKQKEKNNGKKEIICLFKQNKSKQRSTSRKSTQKKITSKKLINKQEKIVSKKNIYKQEAITSRRSISKQEEAITSRKSINRQEAAKSKKDIKKQEVITSRKSIKKDREGKKNDSQTLLILHKINPSAMTFLPESQIAKMQFIKEYYTAYIQKTACSVAPESVVGDQMIRSLSACQTQPEICKSIVGFIRRLYRLAKNYDCPQASNILHLAEKIQVRSKRQVIQQQKHQQAHSNNGSCNQKGKENNKNKLTAIKKIR